MQQKVQTSVQQILEKDMDRSQFLKATGLSFIGLIGVTSVLKSLHSFSMTDTTRPTNLHEANSYGARSYGGAASK